MFLVQRKRWCCLLKLCNLFCLQRIRTDPDLENLRKSNDFDPLLKQFDESFINESAINAIKSLFGFNKK